MDQQHHNILFNSKHCGKVLDVAFTFYIYFLTVTFPHFLLLSQNHIAIFKQTWHNANLGSNKDHARLHDDV
jgi:hypothetical protein